MKRKMIKGFHVVEEGEVKEGGMEEYSVEELESQIRRHRKKVRRRTLIGTAVVLLLLIAVYLVIYLQTYGTAHTVTVYGGADSGNNSYMEFAGGVLKYSKDGAAMLNQKGEEVWNQSYQIKNPMIYVFQESAVIADRGGNNIEVFDKKGLKGEIETTQPIEKAVVSGQGIVSAILKGDAEPQIICYDATGNILAEVKTSMNGAGYPIDISLSENGEKLLVSYMLVENGRVTTNVSYYDFGDTGKKAEEYKIVEDKYENMLAPSVFFMDESVSVVAGDDRLLIYKGKTTPKLMKTISLSKTIKSVFHNDKYIGLVLNNKGGEGYELCLYNKNGKRVLAENFTGDYTNIKISGNQVLMYDGKKCNVYTKSGIHRFEGELEDAIMEMFPIPGVNKYIVMNANGMEVVRFVK